MSSPEGERRAVAEALAAAERHDIAVPDVGQVTYAVRFYSLALPEYGFAYAASKLVHDIAVMALEDAAATPVSLAALSSLSAMTMHDEHVHHLARAVQDSYQLLANLVPSFLTTTQAQYEELRESLRAQGQVSILIVLTNFLEPSPA